MRDLQRHHPDDFWVNCNLASFLPQPFAAPNRRGPPLPHRGAWPSAPGAPSPTHLLGNVFRQKGASDEAIVEYREALRINPDIPQAHHALGRVLASRGELDAAIAEYRKLCRLGPTMPRSVTHSWICSGPKAPSPRWSPSSGESSSRYPDETLPRVQLALVLMISGDLEGYRLRVPRRSALRRLE